LFDRFSLLFSFAAVVVAECIESITGAATTKTTLLLVIAAPLQTFKTTGRGPLESFIAGKFLLSTLLPFSEMTLLLQYFAHVATTQSL
jgi:hypothetical protein